MFGKIVTFFAGLSTAFSCATPNVPEVRSLCQRDDIGNYIVKWETDPLIDGSIRMFVSDVPDYFEETSPVGIMNINEGVTTYITIDNITRKYFLLRFNDQLQDIVGARAVNTDNVQNFRDMGGYLDNNNKMLKWGHIFRSGSLDNISDIDRLRIDNLNLATIIDFRSPDEHSPNAEIYSRAHIVNIPIKEDEISGLKERIGQGRMKKGDAVLFLQDLYLQYVDNHSREFAQALDLFCDKKNYPILFHCTYGKDRTGFLAALILTALGVPEETIMKDYIYSNDYININTLASFARGLNSDAQETITTLLSVNEEYLSVAFNKIKKEYGSLDNYLEKKLNFTTKKRERLKEIMLY